MFKSSTDTITELSGPYITMADDYFVNEGFYSLMGHLAVLYCIYRDTKKTPLILKSHVENTALNFFDRNSIKKISHYDAFLNINKVFQYSSKSELKIPWTIVSFYKQYTSYDKILYQINKFDKLVPNISFEFNWNMRYDLFEKYIYEIINYLYIFNDDIINAASANMCRSNKNFIAVSYRHEYNLIDTPHNKLKIDYYIKALELLNTKDKTILIFSDDILEAKKIFDNLNNQYDIEYYTNISSAVDLCAMSMCSDIICANSSFSFWAAMLNTNKNKRIVCPKKFIDTEWSVHKEQNIQKDVEDIANWLNEKRYPSTWLGI